MHIRQRRYFLICLVLTVCMVSYAWAMPMLGSLLPFAFNNTALVAASSPQSLRTNPQNNLPQLRKDTVSQNKNKPAVNIAAQPVIEEDSIPDSLLHTRWKVQPIVPWTSNDLSQNGADLKRPENLPQTVVYNDTLDRYVFGSKMGNTYVSAPLMMTPEEYRAWSEKQERNAFFRKKNDEIYQAKGKEKFDFTDMHFDLGPAEKIFGPGGVRVRTQGSAELRFGATMKNIENPSLPIRNRKTTSIDFDEKINVSVNGKVGDKVNLNLNYNTDATFDFDTQNLKLKYDGKEDEIIKLVEAGNVSFPSNSSLIKGAGALFGLRTDMQFGKLKLQLVASQKKSSNKSVSSRGGVQVTPFEINATNYEENRHFFLSQYFRDRYDASMRTLPNLTTGVSINRVEVWVTNKTGNTNNTRNIIALTDLGEGTKIYNNRWHGMGGVPSNRANDEYQTLVDGYSSARDIDQSTVVLEGLGSFVGGNDYEKLENARLLTPSEYTINSALGYISLNSSLQTDQVLAVAFEYTHNGVNYQVGEFASDITDVNQALFVKSLKNTGNNPTQGNWDLMMKNVYYLATNVERDKFRLDVKFQNDTTGVYLNYLPEPQVKDQPLIRLLGADRLDNNNKPNANGYFDYVDGYTVSRGRVFFPAVEPFGSYLYQYLINKGIDDATAHKYAFTELYDSTKTIAKQIAEKDKFILVGQYRGSSANVISLGAYNVPRGTVVVTAGGMTLNEGSDYSVDYNAGEVTILNQSILDAGTPVNVSLESNSDFAQERKTMFGVNWAYDFNRNLQLSGTFQHLTEQSLTTKVSMGSEPIKNTLWGLNLNWKKESQWLTNLIDKIPFLHVTQPSQIAFTGEFAHLIAGRSSGTQDNASYLDDFENTKNTIDISSPTSWSLSSVPSMFPESSDKNSLSSGYNRSLMAWYTIDPIFTRRNSSYTPAHIKSDPDQLSNWYVREIPVKELFPQRDYSAYSGTPSTMSLLNVAYYPNERGPYNFSTDLNADGTLKSPQQHWGGMMRKLDTNDFEAANIEYIEFWMLDPFIYTANQDNAHEYGGDVYFNLGDVSEDVLRDGKKFYESGLPVDGSNNVSFTQWGKIPNQTTVTYSFATSPGSRAKQDLGFNGLNDEEERGYESYQPFLSAIKDKVSPAVYDSIMNDPANDNYHYFRGTDYDEIKASILHRYKYINNPQGNSPDSENRRESYDTSYRTTPDVEDINQDYTLNEYEKYFQYHLSLRPQDMVVGKNYIVDKRETVATLRNNQKGHATWYQFRIPLSDYERKFGSITDFTNIRYMRMFLTGFSHPIILRFATLDLVRGEWRLYRQNISNRGAAQSGSMSVSAVNIEENSNKSPVNYVLPPGIQRSNDPTQPQLVQENEQSLSMLVDNLSHGEAKAVYKNTNLDLRQYKRLQMFVHANALDPNATALTDGQLSLFIRLGSDYKNNYYEYEIPLKLTAPRNNYSAYSLPDIKEVWPDENMLDIPLRLFTTLKKQRNKAKASGSASFSQVFTGYDEAKPANKISIMGNPSLGEIKTMVIGVRNNVAETKSGEIWVNELRLRETNNDGGWAAQGNLNIQLSDFGQLNVQGRHISDGFGGLEEGVTERSTDTYNQYGITTSLEMGKFFPDKAKVSIPLYYSITKEEIRPRYNPLDNDMRLGDALEAAANKQERDSIESLVVTRTTNSNFSISNMRVGIQNKRHPMPYDPANFSLSYSHAHRRTTGETTVYEQEDNWRGSLAYSWTPVYKAWEPFKNIKNKSKWYDILKRFGLNWLPQNVTFNTEILRNYYELQERDMENAQNNLPLTFNEQFLWNRDFALRWDITKNIHLNFQSATHAEIEEPYTPVNKERFADKYEVWKDSVWHSISRMGTPLDYNQTFSVSYQLPINLIPVLNWVKADANYNASYNWTRGTRLDDGTSLGNVIANNRDLTINGGFDLVKLYNQIPFLKKANERFERDGGFTRNQREKGKRNKAELLLTNINGSNNKNKDSKNDLSNGDNGDGKGLKQGNSNTFYKQVMLKPDTTVVVTHNKNTKRILVSARLENGKTIELKYKKKGINAIEIVNKVDSATEVMVSVIAKEPLEDKSWYKAAQLSARILMMIRNINVTYRNQQGMSIPGFMPMIGKAFGQNNNLNMLSPGLDFAFGLAGDSYLEKARRNNWLLMNDSVATPAAMNKTEDLQIRVTLEPIKNLKIDLNAMRNRTSSRTIQYMYQGNPTTENGSFTMTTISLGSAFEKIGSANNGFHSAIFERFCRSLDGFRDRVEAQYAGAVYPQGTPLAGKPFDPAHGSVNKYSGDVLIPAFLKAYTGMGGNDLNIFPTLKRLLPNWSLRYSGLSKLPLLRDWFKSVNLNHAYKSIYAVGAYSTFNTYMEYMNGLGFVSEATSGAAIPASMYNVSTVSINESFSPLLGLDMTLQNNMSFKVEYRSTRILALSTTSIQLNETSSKDWVIGAGYKINDFNLFGPRKRKSSGRKNNDDNANATTSNNNNRGFNRDLNLRLDLSYRQQANISRDIATMTSAASNGNSAFKLSFMADYTLSKLLTVSFYFDRQTNTPLLSSSSYPTTTQDFGLSVKFSLTR